MLFLVIRGILRPISAYGHDKVVLGPHGSILDKLYPFWAHTYSLVSILRKYGHIYETVEQFWNPIVQYLLHSIYGHVKAI